MKAHKTANVVINVQGNNNEGNNNEGNNDDEFDFGEDDPLDEEKPGTHLGGIRELVGNVVKKSIGDVSEELEDIAKAVKKLDANKVDIKKQIKPLEEGLENVADTVKDAKKIRDSISKKAAE